MNNPIQRALPWSLALACGATLWFIALRSYGADWHISEIHAHIIYSALVHFREFPYFSHYLNQGSYLLQDPQFPVLSIATPSIVLFGPEAGLRFAAFLFGVGGFWMYFVWLRRHVSARAAMFGAVAWSLSLGILWRIVVGNDMFLWFLVLPLFLLLLEDLFLTPSVRGAVALGLVAGVCVLGPTFHAIVYLLAPVSFVWLILLVHRARVAGSMRPRLLLLVALSLLVACAVAAPRLMAWSAFSMRRVIEADGTMALLPALDSLFSPGKTSLREAPAIVGPTVAGGIRLLWYGIWESSVALPHLGVLLAAVSLASSAVRRSRASILAFALVVLGLMLTTSATIWDGVRVVFPALRVSRRFLILSGFGLSVLAAFGYAEVERRAARWGGAWLALALATVVASTLVWVRGGLNEDLLAGKAVTRLVAHPKANPTSWPLIVNSPDPRNVEAGKVIAGIFHSVGNHCEGAILGGTRCKEYLMRLLATPVHRGQAIPVVAQARAPVVVSHTTITVGPIEPHEEIVLNLIAKPLLGYEIEPAGAGVLLSGEHERLSIVNVGTNVIPRVRITPRSPVPSWFWFPWGALIVAAAGFLLAPVLRRRRAVVASPGRPAVAG